MKRLLILLPLAFLAVFFCYPLASITARGLAPDGAINLSAFGKIVETSSTVRDCGSLSGRQRSRGP